MLKRFEVPSGCFRYHKGTDFQANHNNYSLVWFSCWVVLDTTKVQIFKQITTYAWYKVHYRCVVLDTTKVQIFKQITTYNKAIFDNDVVLDTTKVQIFKQITTDDNFTVQCAVLF